MNADEITPVTLQGYLNDLFGVGASSDGRHFTRRLARIYKERRRNKRAFIPDEALFERALIEDLMRVWDIAVVPDGLRGQLPLDCVVIQAPRDYLCLKDAWPSLVSLAMNRSASKRPSGYRISGDLILFLSVFAGWTSVDSLVLFAEKAVSCSEDGLLTLKDSVAACEGLWQNRTFRKNPGEIPSLAEHKLLVPKDGIRTSFRKAHALVPYKDLAFWEWILLPEFPYRGKALHYCTPGIADIDVESDPYLERIPFNVFPLDQIGQHMRLLRQLSRRAKGDSAVPTVEKPDTELERWEDARRFLELDRPKVDGLTKKVKNKNPVLHVYVATEEYSLDGKSLSLKTRKHLRIRALMLMLRELKSGKESVPVRTVLHSAGVPPTQKMTVKGLFRSTPLEKLVVSVGRSRCTLAVDPHRSSIIGASSSL